VLAGCLLNLGAVVDAARERGGEVAIVCAGVQGAFAMDDAYCAGRIAEELGGDPSDATVAAIRLARSFSSREEGLAASQSARNLVAAGLEEDIVWCARESVLDVVPRVVEIRGSAVEVALA
jgi:2-phosphosulfolactate phosphatase